MTDGLVPVGVLAAAWPGWLVNVVSFLKVLLGFSIIICVHELGHFLAAKWCGIRVDRFAVGFGYRLCGWRRGEGFTFGNRPEYKPEELAEKGFGETDYCFKALPIGGYVRMLGQDDVIIDEKTGAMSLTDDPRAFNNRPIGQRMLVASAGVAFNLLLAAVLLTAIFLHGVDVAAPVVLVPPESRAEGRLQDGDRILAVNGTPVHSFDDIFLEGIFAEGPRRLKVQRDGEVLPGEIEVEASEIPQLRLTGLMLSPYVTPKVMRDWAPVDVPADEAPTDVQTEKLPGGLVRLPSLQKGDVVTSVGGRPVKSLKDIEIAFRESRGRVQRLTVQRPESAEPNAPRREAVCYQRAMLVVMPPGNPLDREPASPIRDPSILGLIPRPRLRALQEIAPDSPAGQAGLKPGDVIAEWGTIANPIGAEIMSSIRENAGKPIRVVVERGGERVGPLSVTPRRAFQLFTQAAPLIRVAFDPFGEVDRLVVADVVPDTPAAALNLPRGAEILSVNDRSVRTWNDLIAALEAAAGTGAKLRYRSGDAEVVATLAVPSSLVNELGLGPSAVIQSIGKQKKLALKGKGGKEESLDLINTWAVSELLRKHVGQAVAITYRPDAAPAQREALFNVRPDNTDPWQMRLWYLPDDLGFESLREHYSAGGNPLRALQMGGAQVLTWIKQSYMFLHMLFVRQSVGVEHVSGPVGIFDAAIKQAKEGPVELMRFLAFISINLAVINFLPIPVMDGGLMLFLLIERIKGKPLSLKTQMITTLVGLAAILLIGLIVTLQDIGRLFN